MNRRAVLALGAALLGGCTGIHPAPAGDAFLFAYFVKNGEDGLHFAGSTDGYHWTKLNGGASYLTPQAGTARLMRDPCILRGPDGTYHLVWTTGWTEKTIGYASSKDLVHWSAQKTLPVMEGEPTALNAWAPEIVYDARRAEFLIFWSSTIPGRFPQTDKSGDGKYNHRIYATTTKDFERFTPAALFYDPGFSVIDASFLRTNGGDYLLVKDETKTPVHKYLQLARAEDLHGPFGKLSAPITPPGLWAEGPTALQVGADLVIYYDAYTSRHFGALRSRDLVHWKDVTSQMSFPDDGTPLRMRHGTAIAVPRTVLDSLTTN